MIDAEQYTADDRYWPVFARTNITFTNNPAEVEYKQFFLPLSTPRAGECRWTEFRAIGHSPGVVIVGIGDGSVHSIHEDIDLRPWSNLILHDDGEIVTDGIN